MADIGLFSFYGGFPRLELLNDVNIGIIRFYGRIKRCMTFAECRPQTADCKCHTPRIELRDLLGYRWQSVSRARRDTSYNDPYRQAPPRKWYFFQPSNFVYLKWGMTKWISRGSLPFKGRYTHRRTGNFRPGGAVNDLPKKFFQVAQIFTKQSRRNKGHTMQQHRPYWHTKLPQYSFSGSIYTCQVWA